MGFSEIFHNRLMADRFVLETSKSSVGYSLPPPITAMEVQQKAGRGTPAAGITCCMKHCKLNLEEAFVDATFRSAKKITSPSRPSAAAMAPRSSLVPLI
jgi:hypothetical protein